MSKTKTSAVGQKYYLITYKDSRSANWKVFNFFQEDPYEDSKKAAEHYRWALSQFDDISFKLSEVVEVEPDDFEGAPERKFREYNVLDSRIKEDLVAKFTPRLKKLADKLK